MTCGLIVADQADQQLAIAILLKVILSEAKNLGCPSRVNSSKNRGFAKSHAAR